MTTATRDLKSAEKHEVASTAEQTRPGVVYQPQVDIFETAQGITLLADMPGVKSEDLTIDLRDSVLTLRGTVRSPEGEGETSVLQEFRWGSYYRQFTLADTIDQGKIEATLSNGVLRLLLPKIDAAKPRQIKVKAG